MSNNGLSYKHIGHSAIDELLRQFDKGASVRVVGISKNASTKLPGVSVRSFFVWLWGIDGNGDVHYMCVGAGSVELVNGQPMNPDDASMKGRFTDEIAAAARLYIVQHGYKIGDGLLTMPDNMTPLMASADFVRFDKESKKIYFESDRVITVEELAALWGLQYSPVGGYVEYIGTTNPFLAEKNSHEFVLIGGDPTSEEYGTARDNHNGASYTIEQVAEFAGVPFDKYDAYLIQNVSGVGGFNGDGPNRVEQDPIEAPEDTPAAPPAPQGATNDTCAECGKPIVQIEGVWYHATLDDPTAEHDHDATPHGAEKVSTEFLEDAAEIAATPEGAE